MRVRDLMNPDVITCPPSTGIAEVARTMKVRNIGMIPVIEGDRLLGVVTDRDITTRCVASGNIDRPVAEVLHGEAVCVSPDATVEEAARAMVEYKIRRLCVTQDGRILGILSLDDILRAGETGLSVEILRQILPEPK